MKEGFMSTRLNCNLAAATLAFSLAFLTSSAHAQAVPAGTPQVTLPDTPVGRTAREWLDAWNSGDSAQLGAFYRKHALERNLGAQMARRNATGGFDLVAIEKSEPRLLEYVLKERATGNTAFTVMELKDDGVGLKQSFLTTIPPGRSAADFRIDAATRKRVLDGAVAKLDTYYVFPDVAAKMAAAVRARLERGEYDGVQSGVTFASRLTEHLRDVSHDLHLGVSFSAAPIPDRSPTPSPADAERFRQQLQSMNCGFVRTETLPGNVGYLKFNMFADVDVCGPTATTAMNSLADVDALIIDLRENGGGQPRMVAFVSSYIFSKRTHLNDLWTRKTNATEEFWTSDVPGKRLGGEKPVYVLTSRRTFSGAEEFTYNLKNLKRATIIGETTGGGAHPVAGHKIDERFRIGVPFARAINPISKTNWEGVGVEPDVKVAAGDALAVAQKLIAERQKP
jgi:hypothetical protein